MPSVIEITKDFPPSRERAVLLELLRVVTGLQDAGISFVICGGWVPFLKELARHLRPESPQITAISFFQEHPSLIAG